MHLKLAVERFIEAKEAGFRSRATITKYADILKSFVQRVGEDKKLEDVGPEDIRNFLSEKRKQGQKPASVDTHYRTLRTFWNWAVPEYGLGANPMDRVEKPRIPKRLPPRLSREDARRLLRAASTSRNPSRDRAILLLLFDCGVRAGELIGLRVKDVDFESRTVRVIGKDQEERVVPISDTTARALKEYLNGRSNSLDDSLFLSARTRGPMTVSGLRQILKRLARVAGLTRSVYPHLLRHTFAYMWVKEGGNLEKLRRIMGHSRLETTGIYASALQEDVEEEHRRLRPAEKIAEETVQPSLW